MISAPLTLMEVYMQIYILPDGSKRQFEVAPEGATPLKLSRRLKRSRKRPRNLPRQRPLKKQRTKQLLLKRQRGLKQNELRY